MSLSPERIKSLQKDGIWLLVPADGSTPKSHEPGSRLAKAGTLVKVCGVRDPAPARVQIELAQRWRSMKASERHALLLDSPEEEARFRRADVLVVPVENPEN